MAVERNGVLRRCDSVAASAVLAVALLGGCAATAPAERGRASLEAAERARVAAMVDADVAALDGALDDSLAYGHNDGRVQSKAELIAAIAGGGLDYREIGLERVEARALDGAGTVASIATVEVSRGVEVLRFRLRTLSTHAATPAGGSSPTSRCACRSPADRRDALHPPSAAKSAPSPIR